MKEKKSKKKTIEIRDLYKYLTNAEIDPRKRILSVMLVATLMGSLLCLIPMLINQVSSVWLNILLALTSLVATIFEVKYKNTDLAGAIIAFATTGFFLPAMYFTQGGCHSGMPVWFIGSTIAFFLLTSRKVRYYVLALSFLVDTGSLVVEYLNPNLVTKLPNENAVIEDIISSFIVCTTAVILVVLVFLSTEQSQRDKLTSQKEELNDKRIQLEYALANDSLTKIENRYSYNKLIGEMTNESPNENVVVISADVNNLKKTNDTYGHDEGDQLIINAAEILSRAFSSYGRVFRTGGDEFIVILQTNKTEDELKQEMDVIRNTSRENEQNKVQFSIGYADNKVIHSSSILELLKIADQRMYDDKQNYYRCNSVNKLNQGCGREGQYRRAILHDAVAFFEVNLSKDRFETAAIHMGNGLPQDLFEVMGITPFEHFTQYVDFFSNSISPEDREAYNTFFDRERLIDCYNNDDLEQTYDCWVTDPTGRRRLSRYIILIGEHDKSHDIIALCISKDITEDKSLKN